MGMIRRFSTKDGGIAGAIELYSDHVIVSGIRQVDIPFDEVKSIDFKPKNLLGPGYIVFQTAYLSKMEYSILEGFHQQNDGKITVINNKKAEVVYKFAKDTLEKYKKSKATGNTNSNNIADTLLKFKSLLDSGVITQAEFDEQKRKLMGR